jgi:hypothetical protein
MVAPLSTDTCWKPVLADVPVAPLCNTNVPLKEGLLASGAKDTDPLLMVAVPVYEFALTFVS